MTPLSIHRVIDGAVLFDPDEDPVLLPVAYSDPVL
jgi:hypothetical protein